MWWLRRSIRTISTSACLSACAAAIPAKPPPTITTRFRSGRGVSPTAVASSGGVSAGIALIGSPLFVFVLNDFRNSLSGTALSTRLREEPRGPARADHSRSDDADAANGLGVRHVISPCLLDCDVGDPSEIALGVEEVALVLAIEIGGIDRTGEVGDEHPVAGNIEGDADPFHQMRDQ